MQKRILYHVEVTKMPLEQILESHVFSMRQGTNFTHSLSFPHPPPMAMWAIAYVQWIWKDNTWSCFRVIPYVIMFWQHSTDDS